MATTFDFVIACDAKRASAARETLAECHRLVESLESELTEFRETSPIFKLNNAPPFSKVSLPASAANLLRQSIALADETSGAFDCMAKSAEESTRRIQLDENDRACREDEGVHVGFGAVGKGYALEKVRTVLAREGFENFLLSAGGSSLVLSGFSKPGVPWEWAWSPGDSSEKMGIAFSHRSGIPLAIGVSGTAEKGAHILDRRNRNSLEKNPLRSALVASTSATEADALSTALFVAGLDETMEKLKDRAIGQP